ncbi:uncharacterized protein PV09_06335 [Verruconis gallopava]|uniref:RRM domain-containing protein n=1 Tax=Verruconis gallopava TaxID=253628 RepID=A0A0D1XIL8_9PEZI|nr:uncharacterized protein PV09_06335 [Verruconis gallopava]KIW02171.1 hypothetical protein PV09_06335 [Verruconis gallopava]
MDNDLATYEDDRRDYEDRSPRRESRDEREPDYSRNRSASPNGRVGDSHAPPGYNRIDDDDGNTDGTNVFVTGLVSSLRDEELRDLFAQYGEVVSASIVRDPHSRESRGFGFVNMATAEEADLVLDKLQGYDLHGRNLSLEKAKRKRPRTPTPGRYQGAPKRDMRRNDRFGDRRGGGRRDDYRSYPRAGDRYSGDRYGSSDRGGDRRYRERDYGYGGGYGGSRGGDSYASRRDDRGYGYRDDRGGDYGRDARPPPGDGYGPPPPGGRSYDDRR